LEKKVARLGATPNPFIDPEGYRQHVVERERELNEQLDREKREAAGAK